MVDVDHAARVGRAELVGDDLHVPREDHEVDLELLHEPDLRVLDLALRGLRDFKYLEAHAERVGDRLEVGVVRDDEGDVAGELAGLVAQEDLPEHVVVLRDEDAQSLGPRAPLELVLELEAAADLVERPLQALLAAAHRRPVRENHRGDAVAGRPNVDVRAAADQSKTARWK